MKVLLTGAAGFIGFHLSRALLARADEVVGVDNLNDYYGVALKEARLALLTGRNGFSFRRLDLADHRAVRELFESEPFDAVVHLAAQAGVRYGLTNPHAYVESNLVAFVNVLEGCRQARPRHFVFASSSSVYGANAEVPFSEHAPADHPLSLYAATKRSNELLAHSYSHLFDLPTTGLRFFTVYGPWGRPDMSYYLFAQAIAEGRPIDVFNHGHMERDFTYVDDIVEGIVRVLDRPAQPILGASSMSPARSAAPFRLFNIGNNQPVKLLHFIELLEEQLGRRVAKRFLPSQPGDVPATYAAIDDLAIAVGFRPSTPVEEGLGRFVAWFRDYHGIRAASRRRPRPVLQPAASKEK